MVESTKASVDVEAPAAGFVRRVAFEKGQRAKVNAALCAITETAAEDLPREEATAVRSDGVRVTRKAQELAARHGIDLEASGLTGLVKEADVERLVAAREAAERPRPTRDPLPLPTDGRRAVLVFGASGHARVLVDLMRLGDELVPISAVDDGQAEDVLGVPVVGASSRLAELRAAGYEHAILGIGLVQNHAKRVVLYERLVAAGFTLPNLVHPRAMVEPSVTMGVGNQIFAGAVIGSAAKLGDDIIVNSGAVVSHDCEIGSHTHVSPGAILAGSVRVGEGTLIGMGVTVYLGVRIGNNVTIANGCHVMSDVPDGAVIRATPGRSSAER